MSNKVLAQVFVVFVLCIVICYAFASLMNGSFDFATWESKNRTLTGILSFLFSSTIAVVVWEEGSKKDDSEDSE